MYELKTGVRVDDSDVTGDRTLVEPVCMPVVPAGQAAVSGVVVDAAVGQLLGDLGVTASVG